MKERYKRNYSIHTKSGKFRKEGIVSRYIHPNNKTVSPAEKDRENRENVLKRIKEHVESGGELNEILDMLCNDEEINIQFEYLKKNGIDLRNTFESWYKSYKKTLSKRLKMIEQSNALNKENGDYNDYR